MSEFKREAIPQWLRYHIMNRDSFMCRYCSSILDVANIHIDHINPLSNGGTNRRCNLTTACPNCNLKKSDSINVDEISLLHLYNAKLELSGWGPSSKMERIPDKLIEDIKDIIEAHTEEDWMLALEISCAVSNDFCDRVDMLRGITIFLMHGGKL